MDWAPLLHNQTWSEIEKAERESEKEALRRQRRLSANDNFGVSDSRKRSSRVRREVSYVPEAKRLNTLNAAIDPIIIDYSDNKVFVRPDNFWRFFVLFSWADVVF